MAAFSNSVRSFRTGFILIAASCFLIGFVAQIFFFSSNQHNSSHSSFHPKDIIDDHLSKGLDRGDFQRLLEIEKKFADQFSELENLKRLIGINKARLAANEEPRIISRQAIRITYKYFPNHFFIFVSCCQSCSSSYC